MKPRNYPSFRPNQFRVDPIRWISCNWLNRHAFVTMWGGHLFCADCGTYIETPKDTD